MHPVSHPILPFFPTRESSGFSFLPYCTLSLRKKISLAAALFTRFFLKSKPSFIPNPRGSWFSSHKWKQSPLFVFSKHCFSYEFLLVFWLIRYDLGACFCLVLCLLLFCIASSRGFTWKENFAWGCDILMFLGAVNRQSDASRLLWQQWTGTSRTTCFALLVASSHMGFEQEDTLLKCLSNLKTTLE